MHLRPVLRVDPSLQIGSQVRLGHSPNHTNHREKQQYVQPASIEGGDRLRNYQLSSRLGKIWLKGFAGK